MFFRPVAVQHVQRLQNHVRVGRFHGHQHVREIPDSLRGGIAVPEQIVQQFVPNRFYCIRWNHSILCNCFIFDSFVDDVPGAFVQLVSRDHTVFVLIFKSPHRQHHCLMKTIN